MAGSIFTQFYNFNHETGLYSRDKLDIAGYIPVVISGFGRALFGVVQVIVNLAKLFFDKENRSNHIHNLKTGLAHIVRGVVEMIPVLGNAACIIFDAVILKKLNSVQNFKTDEESSEEEVSEEDTREIPPTYNIHDLNFGQQQYYNQQPVYNTQQPEYNQNPYQNNVPGLYSYYTAQYYPQAGYQ